MSNVRQVDFKNQLANESVISLLEILLIEAKKGNLIGLAGIAEYTEGAYQPISSSTLSRLQTAGALLDAAVARLQDG